MKKKTTPETKLHPPPKSDETSSAMKNATSETHKPKKPYSKPALTRYGTVKDLTASGQPGTSMDAQFPGGGTKTGF